jgi:hypothetical protein
MPLIAETTVKPRFRGLFPDWTGFRPLHFFFTENLLEARRASMFPTNGAGPDEDVNVYLSHLLTSFITGHHDPRITLGAGGLHHPPGKNLGRRQQADWYRVNGDHRLLYLGLMNRGDGLRRRDVPYGFEASESRDRDIQAGRACFGLAANLLEGRGGAPGGLVSVWRKLEENYEDYVHVLGVLAVRHLGMGANLNDDDLAGLFREAS